MICFRLSLGVQRVARHLLNVDAPCFYEKIGGNPSGIFTFCPTGLHHHDQGVTSELILI